jgi:hypothetical protein
MAQRRNIALPQTKPARPIDDGSQSFFLVSRQAFDLRRRHTVCLRRRQTVWHHGQRKIETFVPNAEVATPSETTEAAHRDHRARL